MQFGQAELQQLPPLRIVVACGLEQFGVQVAGHPGNQGIVSALKQWLQLGWIGLLLDLAPAFEPQQLSLEPLQQLVVTLMAGQVEAAALFEQQQGGSDPPGQAATSPNHDSISSRRRSSQASTPTAQQSSS